MKKITYGSIGLFLLMTLQIVKAQSSNDECIKRYNFFKGDYQVKNYTDAKKELLWLMQNCPKLSVNIYIYGNRIAEKTADNNLIKKIYKQRLLNFPNKDVAKTHSNYATFLSKNKLATNSEIFSILEKAYQIDPTKMSVRNIYKYFQEVTNKYKDIDPQKVFDTYDDVVDAVKAKLENYTKKIAVLKLKEPNLDHREDRKLKIYTINSKALGMVEGGLDNIISSIATCNRLIPIYAKDFEKNKNNIKWLKRAVSRLHNKGCQSDQLYERLARAYAESSKSANAYSFLAGVLAKNGDKIGANQMRKKAFDLETDPYKKANYKLKFAQTAKNMGQKSKARSLAREALKLNPHLGRAYLFIANLYALSANSCGKNEFEKRMVYVAALNKAIKAALVDPSISAMASRFINNYKHNIPSKKLIFQQGIASGTSYTIKCWIGETVKIP